MTDAETVAAVLAGDRGRFAELVERHGRPLFGWLARRTLDAEEARDVFQDTWVRAFEALADLRDPGRVRAWLFTIASNGMRSRGRRAASAPGVDPEQRPSDLAARGEVDPLEAGDLRDAQRRALARLTDRQREVFELRVGAGLAHAEIADLLGIREDNARAHYHHAVIRLRELLSNYHDSPES